MAKQQFQTVRGMHDILPENYLQYRHLLDTFYTVARAAGFAMIDTPMVEQAGVFSRGVGVGTDVVDKEMYTLDDRSGNQLALRPEPTAAVVRSYIQHGMASLAKPVKLQIAGPMFRYDRPQAGRQRQFTQVGVEVFGESAASMDAQVIALADRYYRRIGLSGLQLQINSIGDAVCRPKYKAALVGYFKKHESALCETCSKRLTVNPLRILDCKEEKCQALLVAAPQTLDYLCADCSTHFAAVLEYLDTLGIKYELSHLLVRGLDYYTRTVFEFYGDRQGAQSSLGGGGRYDGLVEQLGGQPTAAVGFGMGIERLLIELQESDIGLPVTSTSRVFVASLGEAARLAGFKLIETLLDNDVPASGSVDRDGIGGQLERANKLGVPYAIIIGQKEVDDQTVILRDMQSGAQEIVALKGIVKEMLSRLSL